MSVAFNTIVPVFSVIAVGYLLAGRRSLHLPTLADLALLVACPALIFSLLAGTAVDPGQWSAMVGGTVWIATGAVSPQQRTLARSILEALGQEIEVENEDYLDMATALSGTGPSYVFLFMEAMIDAGVHMGFPRRIAERLVSETIRGTLRYYERSPRHPARLRNEVTSPGGTSAAALYYLEKAGFRTALARAIWAAYERSVELGQGKKRGSADGS